LCPEPSGIGQITPREADRIRVSLPCCVGQGQPESLQRRRHQRIRAALSGGISRSERLHDRGGPGA
jgi:hypothetical protein